MTVAARRSPRYLGKIRARALTAHLVAGPADSLQTGGDRRWGFDLDHQVDGSHIDAEFERRGRDDRLEVASLEGLLDQDPLLAGHRPVVGPADLLTGQGVDLAQIRSANRRELANRMVERWVLDELEEAGVDRRPDRGLAGGLSGRGGRAGPVRSCRRPAR